MENWIVAAIVAAGFVILMMQFRRKYKAGACKINPSENTCECGNCNCIGGRDKSDVSSRRRA